MRLILEPGMPSLAIFSATSVKKHRVNMSSYRTFIVEDNSAVPASVSVASGSHNDKIIASIRDGVIGGVEVAPGNL